MKTKNKMQRLQNLKHGELKDDFAFKYLHKQFPWLSESEIKEAIELKGSNADHVIKYLNEKSGEGKTVDQDY